MTTLYNCKSEIDGDGQTRYRITKFDSDMTVESSYITDGVACECPAGERPICRHRTMLPRFIARGAVNSMWMHDFDRNGWVSMGNAEAEVEQEEGLTQAYSTILGRKVDAVYKGVPIIQVESIGEVATGSKPIDPSKFEGFSPRINRRGF